VGDIGMMRTPGGATLLVSDVTKAGGGELFVHTCRLATGTLRVDDEVNFSIVGNRYCCDSICLYDQHCPYIGSVLISYG
jgi:alanyl-tRNA synthetase